jgi:hypothetical protein
MSPNSRTAKWFFGDALSCPQAVLFLPQVVLFVPIKKSLLSGMLKAVQRHLAIHYQCTVYLYHEQQYS